MLELIIHNQRICPDSAHDKEINRVLINEIQSNMIKKEANLTRPIRRINLSLPIIRNNSYEIYKTVSPEYISNDCSLPNLKPLYNYNKKLNNHPTKLRSSDHSTGPMLITLCVHIPTESSSTIADTISNGVINSKHTLSAVPTIMKRNKHQNNQLHGKQSQTSCDNKLFYDSIELFDESLLNPTENVHVPLLTKVKVLHNRKTLKNTFTSNDSYLRVPNTSSIENLSHKSVILSNERRQKRVEKLTKYYFPTIQQLRHAHPCPKLIHNRMHLHREEKRDFISKNSRSHVFP